MKTRSVESGTFLSNIYIFISKETEMGSMNQYEDALERLISTIDEKWSDKYKKSIDCNNPKGFSQKAHCAGRKKKGK